MRLGDDANQSPPSKKLRLVKCGQIHRKLISFSTKNMNLQSFSMPRSTMLYMIKAHKSLGLHQMFMRMCKYTFDKNRIVPVYGLDWQRRNNQHSWVAKWEKNYRVYGGAIVLGNGGFKMWILECCLLGMLTKSLPLDAISKMLKKTYRLDSDISLIGQRLSLDEFKLLCLGTINHMSFAYGSIKDENDSIVPIRIVLDYIPKTKIVEYHFLDRIDKKIVMEEIAVIISTLSSHTETEIFEIHGLTDEFDIDSIDSFLMDTNGKQFQMYFTGELTSDYMETLENYIRRIDEQYCK